VNQQWYQSAVDLMLSRSAWDVFELADKFTQILDPNDLIQPNFQTWFTTLFIAGDRGNIPGDNVLKTQHIVESLLDPDFNRDILANYPEGAVFPSRVKMIHAIQRSDYLDLFPELKSNTLLHSVTGSAETIDCSLEQSEILDTLITPEFQTQSRREEIIRPYLSRKLFSSRLNLVFDLVNKHGEASLNWSKPLWFKHCYKARPDLFADSMGKKISDHGFKKFWDEAKPLINSIYT
jgi:hypothetical protein